MMRKLILMTTMLCAFPFASPLLIATAQADITLPSYAAGGDVKSKVESVGKKVTDTVALVVAVIAILCMVGSGGYFAAGRSDDGKRLLFGSIAGLVIAGMAYGIASMVT